MNSNHDAIADAAQDEWEVATRTYQHQLKRVLRTAPPAVVELARACYHDAVLSRTTFDPSGREQAPEWGGGRVPPSLPRPSPATLNLTLPGRSIALVYLVWDAVRVAQPDPEWTKHKGSVLWLYDEIDEIWSRFGMFVHRILFSNGEAWEIPFSDVVRIEVAVPDIPSAPRTA